MFSKWIGKELFGALAIRAEPRAGESFKWATQQGGPCVSPLLGAGGGDKPPPLVGGNSYGWTSQVLLACRLPLCSLKSLSAISNCKILGCWPNPTSFNLFIFNWRVLPYNVVLISVVARHASAKAYMCHLPLEPPPRLPPHPASLRSSQSTGQPNFLLAASVFWLQLIPAAFAHHLGKGAPAGADSRWSPPPARVITLSAARPGCFSP